MARNRSFRFIHIVILTMLGVAACGGGGSGGSGGGISPPPVTGWQPGVFAPEQNFANRCVSPRTGIDPATNQPYPDLRGSILDENNFLRSWSNRTYLWYDEIVDRNPAGYNDALDYFDVLKTTALSPTGAPKDKFHFTYDSAEWFQLSQGGVSSGYGVTWVILNPTPPRQVLVAYTEPNTPATANNLLRGAEVLEVDGVDINTTTQAGVDTLNAGLFPSGLNESHALRVRDPGGAVRLVTIVSGAITAAMVQNTRVINTPTGDVGYMTFNYHRAPAEQALIAAINALQGVDDLVLDIRYNGGGFLAIASQLAYMIAGPGPTAGRVFELLQFNDKHPSTNPITGQAISPAPFYDETLGFSVVAGQTLPSLGLSRVFVLTGSGTCSASESIMNGLRGAGVEVIQIGSTTCGKPYGFYEEPNCGTSYFTIQFRGVNDVNFGDYTDGFSPALVDDGRAGVRGCQVADDFSEQLGSPAENRLEVALAYQAGLGCVSPVQASSGWGLAKPAPGVTATDGMVYRSPFDSNRIVQRP